MTLMKSQEYLKAGDLAPNFKLPGIDGKTYSLDLFKDKVILIIFMCNHCPYVIPKFKTIKNIQSKFKKDLVIIGINSNDPSQYPEDSFANMKKIAKEEKFNFLYLFDETQKIAKAYGATCTPDPFLFNKNKRLVYHGRLDNALNPEETPTSHEMIKAIETTLQNKKPKESFLYSMGCSIKWK